MAVDGIVTQHKIAFGLSAMLCCLRCRLPAAFSVSCTGYWVYLLVVSPMFALSGGSRRYHTATTTSVCILFRLSLSSALF